MSTSSKAYEIRRTSDWSEIINILQATSSVISSSDAILIGSRAAEKYLPNLRGTNKYIDWDFISSSTYLLEWLRERETKINTIEMIIPISNEDQLDLYITCTLKEGLKYDFAVPRSTTSYTAYLLNNLVRWTYTEKTWYSSESRQPVYAEAELLLILKKYMLYYPHQWQKTAKDYRQLLSVTDPLVYKDKELYDLFIRYNEKLHGQRASDAAEFVITPRESAQNIVIRQDDFVQYTKDEKILCIYQAASTTSIDDDLLTGLEYMCTKSPPWLADFIIDNWMDIHNEKFKQRRHLSRPSIQFEISNDRLFEQLPELTIQQILLNITDPLDFNSMKFVCKNWYAILGQQSFWRDLFRCRYGHYSGDVNKVTDWKLLYIIKLEKKIEKDKIDLQKLIHATTHLRKTTADNVLQLWTRYNSTAAD